MIRIITFVDAFGKPHFEAKNYVKNPYRVSPDHLPVGLKTNVSPHTYEAFTSHHFSIQYFCGTFELLIQKPKEIEIDLN